MRWLEHEWRMFIEMMTMRVGPKKRPFGEIFAYAIFLALAIAWGMIRWHWLTAF